MAAVDSQCGFTSINTIISAVFIALDKTKIDDYQFPNLLKFIEHWAITLNISIGDCEISTKNFVMQALEKSMLQYMQDSGYSLTDYMIEEPIDNWAMIVLKIQQFCLELYQLAESKIDKIDPIMTKNYRCVSRHKKVKQSCDEMATYCSIVTLKETREYIKIHDKVKCDYTSCMICCLRHFKTLINDIFQQIHEINHIISTRMISQI